MTPQPKPLHAFVQPPACTCPENAGCTKFCDRNFPILPKNGSFQHKCHGLGSVAARTRYSSAAESPQVATLLGMTMTQPKPRKRRGRFLQLVLRHDRIWLAKNYPLPRRVKACVQAHRLIVREAERGTP